MTDRFEITWLFDFYGPLLTARQKEMLSFRLEDDLSLSEIAEAQGVSRQAVCDAMQRAQERLESYERNLGLLKRYRRISEGLTECLHLLKDVPGDEAEKARQRLVQLLSEEER